MKISREWLADYVDLTDISDSELAAKLTSIGHAVESIETHEGSSVFDIEFTTNRVDAMSHLGLARELSAALGREMLTGTYDFAEPDIDPAVGAVPIRIETADLCSRYTGLVIRDVTVRESSHRVRSRLEAVGLRPINNIVDATNYIMMATGHPMHAFDLDKLAGPEIRVRRGAAGEVIRTLDGEERRADENTVVIADRERGTALGGIMGGHDSEISGATRNILLECAHFAPAAIRATARRLGMKSDASYRFERGVDPNDTVAAIEQAAGVIIGEAGGRRGAPIDVIAEAAEPRTIALRFTTLETASAGVIGPGYALELFVRMGMQPKRVPDGIQVTVPTWRGDLGEESDLVEEILRFYGFDNLPAVMPRVTSGDVRREAILGLEESVRELLIGSGLTEVINYSFIHPAHNAAFSSEEALKITNALTENIASMRLSLIPGLLETVAFNRSYGTRDAGIFEIGRTYHLVRGEVREVPRVAWALAGSTPAHWSGPRRPFDYFDAKGIAETMLDRLHVEAGFSAADVVWLRKGQSAAIESGGDIIGFLGMLSKDLGAKFDLKGDLFAAELDLQKLHAAIREWKMKPVSRYPGIPMVLGVLHAPSLSVQSVLERIRSLDTPYLQEVGVRDRYVPEDGNDVKTTFGMWYQAADQSLAQETVAEIHGRLAERLSELLPIRIQ